MSPITLSTVAYGRPATELLGARIAAVKADDALAPVTVVVPTNDVGVCVRRLLASGELGSVTGGAGVAGLAMVTVSRLAELLGAPRLAASHRRPVTIPVVAAAVRRVLTERPGVFAPVADHPATEQALVGAYRELSELGQATLDRLAAQSERAGEVVRVRREARALLEPDWYEEADLMRAAAAALAQGAAVLGDLGTVIVYLPQALSVPAADLLTALAEHTPVEVIAGRTGVADADADIDHTLGRLGLTPPNDDGLAAPAGTHVESVTDAEEEARSAVSHVLQAARQGVALERMAILYPATVPYARLVAEQLDAAGIASNGRAVKPLTERLAGRWLLDLLALADRRYARPAVMGLLTGAPVLGADGHPIPASAWERISREAGIVVDRRQWPDKLARLAADLRRRADLEDAEEAPREWLSARHRHQAAEADRLEAFTRGLFDRLASAAGLTSWRGLSDWATATLRRYLGGDDARAHWPDVERDAADRVEAALERLAALDHVGAHADLAVFRRTLELELDAELAKVGELGRGVMVGPVSAGLGLDLDVTVVLGLAEGVLPTRCQEDSLLPDAERAACGHELALRADHVGVQHRHLLAALAASGGQGILLCPRGDLRRNTERVASRWLWDTVARLDPQAREGELPADAAWHTPVASFAQRVGTVTFPATGQEYRLRALADATAAGQRLADQPLVAGDPALGRGVELVAARSRAAFSRFDGNVGGLAAHLTAPAEADEAVSPTAVEQWLACPHAYFMARVLGVEPVDNPEELLEIDARERGSLIHEVLRAWLDEQLAGAPPAPSQPWSASARRRLRELAEQRCDDAEQRGATGHWMLWRRDRQRILGDLDRFVDADDARRAEHGLTPLAAEQPFGVAGAGAGPVAIPVPDGRLVWVRGRIDRVDRRNDGGLALVDYKTGKADDYRDVCAEQPLGADGTKLQLAVYGRAAGELDGRGGDACRSGPGVDSAYWFVSSRGDFAVKGFEVTDEVLDELGQAVGVATDGIAAGAFPPRPPTPQWRPYTPCVYCDPDDLGTADRRRDWERVRQDGALAAYVAYVEPEALESGHTQR
jgi:hypothetical protein